MSGVFPPGARPDQWSTLGDHQRRIQDLEAVPCCFDSNLGPNTTYTDLVLANPCLADYWPMNDVGPGAADAFGTLDLAENPAGSSFTQPVGSQGAFSFAYEQTGPWPTAPDATAVGFSGNDLTFSTGTILYTALGAGNPLQSNFTVAGWAYISDTSLHIFWDFYTGTVAFLSLSTFGSSPNIKFSFDSNNGGVIGSTSIAQNTWYFVAVTYSAGVMNLYVNGVLDATGSHSSGTGSSTGTLRFGAGGKGANGPTNHLTGRQAQVAMFNCALTAAEVAELAAATNEPSVFAEAGSVPVADGGGGYTWEFPLEVTY